MALALVFLLGIGNFALHRAVLDSGHPALASIPWIAGKAGGRISLVLEFLVLLTALLLVGNGLPGWGWAYFAYSLLNGVAAWLILSRRL